MDPFNYGDPYIEWNEENSAKEVYEENETGEVLRMSNLDVLKETVVKLLITTHDFSEDEAESSVEESCSNEPGMWSVNAEAEEIAKYLASDEASD